MRSHGIALATLIASLFNGLGQDGAIPRAGCQGATSCFKCIARNLVECRESARKLCVIYGAPSRPRKLDAEARQRIGANFYLRDDLGSFPKYPGRSQVEFEASHDNLLCVGSGMTRQVMS
jgi:hypothetical protein